MQQHLAARPSSSSLSTATPDQHSALCRSITTRLRLRLSCSSHLSSGRGLASFPATCLCPLSAPSHRRLLTAHRLHLHPARSRVSSARAFLARPDHHGLTYTPLPFCRQLCRKHKRRVCWVCARPRRSLLWALVLIHFIIASASSDDTHSPLFCLVLISSAPCRRPRKNIHATYIPPACPHRQGNQAPAWSYRLLSYRIKTFVDNGACVMWHGGMPP